MSYAKPASSVKVDSKIKWKEKQQGRSKKYNAVAGLVAFTGLVPTKRKITKSSFGPATHSSNLGFSSGTLGGPTSPALAFPLMSASSSLSSSLSFLMQSKYSFCLSRAWPHTHTREKTREREKRQRRSWIDSGQTCNTTRHLSMHKHALCTSSQQQGRRNKQHTQTRTRLHAHRGCYWGMLRGMVEDRD